MANALFILMIALTALPGLALFLFAITGTLDRLSDSAKSIQRVVFAVGVIGLGFVGTGR